MPDNYDPYNMNNNGFNQPQEDMYRNREYDSNDQIYSYSTENPDSKPPKKHTFLKVIVCMLLLAGVSAGSIEGYKFLSETKKELAAYRGTVDISAETKVVQGIAFVNIEAKKFEYVEGSGNVDICWDSRSECDEDNQINHVINMYNKKLSQIKTLVDELTKAKAAGATHVIDSSYTSVKDFEFNK